MSFILEGSALEFECPPNVDADSRQILQGREYDIADIQLPAPPVVIDIGANCGAFSVWASRKWPGATLHSYEPHPLAFRYLESNAKRFGLSATNAARLNQTGVRARAGVEPLLIGMCRGEENLLCSSFIDIGSQGAAKVSVSVTAAEQLPPCNILKVDTEGCELEIITAYLASHVRGRPALILLEAHSRTDRVTLENLLDGEHYEIVGGHMHGPNISTLAFLHMSFIPDEQRAR